MAYGSLTGLNPYQKMGTMGTMGTMSTNSQTLIQGKSEFIDEAQKRHEKFIIESHLKKNPLLKFEDP